MENKTKNKKSALSKVFSILSYIILGIMLLLVVYSVYMKATNTIPNFFGYSIMQIVSPSMEPEIKTGDYIITKECKPNEVKEGDIISFYSLDPAIKDKPNTHRVIEINTDENGSLVFTTKGDNNPIKDKYPVTQDKLIGICQGSVGWLTAIGRVVNNPIVFFLIVLIPAGVLVFIEIKNVKNKAKELKKQQLIEQEVERLKQADKQKQNNSNLEDEDNNNK